MNETADDLTAGTDALMSEDVAAAPANTPDAEPKARPKPEPVRSLCDLYTVKGANAAKLLRELDKGPSWKFADDDVDGALALIEENDPHLLRTRQLLHEAIETREGKFARTACDFVLRVLEPEVRGLDGWPPVEDTDPVASLSALAGRVAGGLGDSKRERRAHNVLMIGVDVLSHRRAVAFETIAPVLRDALGTPATGARRNPRRHRVASMTSPRNDLARVRDLLDLLQPWEDEVRASEEAAAAASADAQDAHLAADRAEVRARELEHQLRGLQQELDAIRQEADAARDQAQDVRVHASVDVSELRARSVGFLNSRLRDLLATAKEASEVEPPRTATAVRLLEQAIRELHKEVEWLRSSV